MQESFFVYKQTRFQYGIAWYRLVQRRCIRFFGFDVKRSSSSLLRISCFSQRSVAPCVCMSLRLHRSLDIAITGPRKQLSPKALMRGNVSQVPRVSTLPSTRIAESSCLYSWNIRCASWSVVATRKRMGKRCPVIKASDRPKAGWSSITRTSFSFMRSEERRVGKECRSRWSPCHYKKKKKT